jgi:nucleoside phosphorylase
LVGGASSSLGHKEACLSEANVDVLILTALTEEQQVVHAVLQRCARYVSTHGALPNRVALYEYACKDGARYLLATASTHDMGAVAMSGFATLLLASGVRPGCAALVGIAASLTREEFDVGDVAVASAVFSADDIKVENGTLTFRTHGYQTDRLMCMAAGSLREQGASHAAWRAECVSVVTGVAEELSADGLRTRPITVPADVKPPRLAVEPGVGGPFLIADAAFGEALRKGTPTVAPLNPKIAWAEMEAHGFMRAMHAAAVPAIVLKGISDAGDADKARLERETGGFFRVYACSNSVIAVLHLLAQRPRDPVPSDRRLDATTSSAHAAASAAAAAADARASDTSPRPSRSTALDLWQEKLEFLLVEEARTVDADMKFRLKHLITEAEEKIRALSNP